MNGAQQVERFTAVRRAEKRVEDVETIVTELDTRLAALAALVEALEGRQIHLTRVNREAFTVLADWQAAVDARTFWQRLRWFVRGR